MDSAFQARIFVN